MSVTDADSPYSLQFWLSEYEEHNDWPAVRRIAKELLHLMPDHPEGLRYLAEAYFRLGDAQAAYRTAQRLTIVAPWCPDGFWILADLYSQADDLERSVDCLEQAARRMPGCDAIWVETARAYFHLGQWGRCLVASDQGLRVNRCNIRLWILKVFCLGYLRRLPAAKLAAQRLLELGVEAEDLREAARELGITGATISAMQRLVREGQLPPAKSLGSNHAAAGVVAGSEVIQDTLSQRKPLTQEEFQQAWLAAQRCHEMTEDSELCDLSDPQERLQPDRSDMETQDVYYVYDRYRVWGPYSGERLRAMLLHGEFSLREAWLRGETHAAWVPAADVFPDLVAG